MNDTCLAGQLHKDFVPLHFVLAHAVLLCTLTVISTSIFRKYYWREMWYHKNFKILLSVYFFLFDLNSIALGSILFYNLVSYYVFESACDVMVPIWICFAFRFVTKACFNSLSLLNLAMSLERFIATVKRDTYETSKWPLGATAALFSVVVGTQNTWWVMGSIDFVGSVPLCSSVIGSSSDPNKPYNIFLWMIEGLKLSSVVLLAVWNFYGTKVRVFNLSSNFQLRENRNVIGLLLAMMGFHSLITLTNKGVRAILFFYQDDFSDMVLVAVNEGANIFPYYTVFLPLLLVVMIRRIRNSRKTVPAYQIDQHVMYFEAYAQAWSTSPTEHNTSQGRRPLSSCCSLEH